MPDSGDIDNALIAKLGADAALLSHVRNGVYWEDEGPPSAKANVMVSLASSDDTRVYGARAFEDNVYIVKAAVLSTEPDAKEKAKRAAARIDELLDPQPPAPRATLIVPGYSVMTIRRAEDVPRIHTTERDDADSTVFWYHRGAYYRVVVSVAGN